MLAGINSVCGLTLGSSLYFPIIPRIAQVASIPGDWTVQKGI